MREFDSSIVSALEIAAGLVGAALLDAFWWMPFLFGAFGAADAMYAPVTTRFRTYAVRLSPICEAYCQAVFADPDFKAWEDAGRRDKPASDDLPPKP